MTKRHEILSAAIDAVCIQRNDAYGEPEDNLARIAQLWTVLFERDVTPRQVAWAFVLTKVARDMHAPNEDNPVDVAGYAALAGEVSAVPVRRASGFDDWLALTRRDVALSGAQLVRDMRDVHPWAD